MLRYLVGCASSAAPHRRFDIGGPDVLTYAEMMHRYAAVAGSRSDGSCRSPLLSPSLSSHWVGLVTPVPAGSPARWSSRCATTVVCREHDIAAVRARSAGGAARLRRGGRLALQRVRDADVSTRWASASVPGAPPTRCRPTPTGPAARSTSTSAPGTTAPPEALWRVVEGIGGENGWYSFPLAWEVRGLLDRMVGGVGLRRGRRDPHRLYVGDTLDFWRVEAREPGRLLRLRAEMRLPGLAWLEFHVEPTARAPSSGSGPPSPRADWPGTPTGGASPFHGVVFGGMLRGLVRAAEQSPA